jgi:hypothetical protein
VQAIWRVRGCRDPRFAAEFIRRSGGGGQAAQMDTATDDPELLAPAELALLELVLDDACERRGLHRTGRDAENIAAEVVALYTRGVRHEQELGALIS